MVGRRGGSGWVVVGRRREEGEWVGDGREEGGRGGW